MELAPDFDEFIGSLIAHGVEFVVVGAYALAFHGAPRSPATSTSSSDQRSTTPRVCFRRSAAFGFPVEGLNPEAIADPRRLLEMGVPPVQIHVMSSISGVDWDQVWSGSVEGALGSHKVRFIGREAFVQNKRTAGRPKDLADIDALEPGADQ